MSERTILTSGWHCSKRCPYWEPKGFREWCSAYNQDLEFNHVKNGSKRCPECLFDYPTNAEPERGDYGV